MVQILLVGLIMFLSPINLNQTTDLYLREISGSNGRG